MLKSTFDKLLNDISTLLLIVIGGILHSVISYILIIFWEYPATVISNVKI